MPKFKLHDRVIINLPTTNPFNGKVGVIRDKRMMLGISEYDVTLIGSNTGIWLRAEWMLDYTQDPDDEPQTVISLNRDEYLELLRLVVAEGVYTPLLRAVISGTEFGA